MAWATGEEPPLNKVGFGYMLQGGSDPSNDDIYTEAPPEGQPWLTTGPHVMIFNLPERPADYPLKPHEEQVKDTSEPYIMWGNTPYEHLMIPVEYPGFGRWRGRSTLHLSWVRWCAASSGRRCPCRGAPRLARGFFFS